VELTGTSGLVVGGSSGLGLATARALVSRGVRVVVLSRNEPRGAESAERIGATYCPGDAADAHAVVAALDTATSRAPLRSLVVCAGTGHAERTIGRDGRYESAHDLDAFREVVEANLVGTFNCVRLGATAMARQPADAEGQRGCVVLTSSAAAHAGQVGQAAYAAAKAGLAGLLLPVARDLAPAGIRINAVRPAGFDTGMYGPNGVSDALRGRLADSAIFPSRMGRPEEFAGLVLELLTNDYLNATTIDLDAGTRTLPR
jgi:NAD(P)-dependent dehydrogenase (short-subunit alcohol dehydrogenase family)